MRLKPETVSKRGVPKLLPEAELFETLFRRAPVRLAQLRPEGVLTIHSKRFKALSERELLFPSERGYDSGGILLPAQRAHEMIWQTFCFRMLMLLEGEGGVVVEDKMIQMKPGEVVCIPKMTAYSEFCSNPKKGCHFTITTYPLVNNAHLMHTRVFPGGDRFVKGRLLSHIPLIPRCWELLHGIELKIEDGEAPLLEDILEVWQLVIAAKVTALRHRDHEEQSKEAELVGRVREIIRQNLSDTPHLNEIADRLEISRRHVLRCIRSQWGCNFVQFREQIRLSHACHLLHQNQQIKKVAYETGYHDASAFSKAFQKKFGVSPMGYQQKRV